MTTILLSQKEPALKKLLRYAPAITILFCMLFFLRNAALTKDWVLTGLQRAALGVLPSVFPFLVLSDLLTSAGGLPEWMGNWIARPLKLPGSAGSAILLGWICGFPIGASYLAKQTGREELTESQASRAVAAASIPSPAFLVGAVGIGYWNSAAAGAMLWGGCVLSAFLGCLFSGFFQKEPVNQSKKTAPVMQEPLMRALTASVVKAAVCSLNLCACIVFFSVLAGAVSSVLCRFGAPALAKPVFTALLEISGGIAAAVALPNADIAVLICAAACGWSGLSVHFQIFSVCQNLKISAKKYLLAKGVQAILCLVFAALFAIFKR